MSMEESKETTTQMPEHIELDGNTFKFVKDQRDGDSAVYKGQDSYLRIGSPEKIHSDLALHKRMESVGFPVAKLLTEGELNGKSYFVESSVGEKMLSTAFAEDTEAMGVISEESFNQFLNITDKFARAQLRTQIPERDYEEFADGIHLGILCQELPEYADQIQDKFKQMQERIVEFPFVISHGDFNPHNLYPDGIIDLEDSYHAPFGHDLVGGLVSTEYFPASQEFEFFSHYRFSKEQKKQYFELLDGICKQHNLPTLSDFESDFEFTRAVWLLVKMHKWPKIQQFRYDKFIKKFLNG